MDKRITGRLYQTRVEKYAFSQSDQVNIRNYIARILFQASTIINSSQITILSVITCIIINTNDKSRESEFGDKK